MRREFADRGGSQPRQDMRLSGSLRLIDSLATAPLVSLKVVSHGTGDGERTLPGVVPFLSPRLRSPPLPRSPLGLAVVKNGNPVSVLQSSVEPIQ
jgi:hypothetical protein